MKKIITSLFIACALGACTKTVPQKEPVVQNEEVGKWQEAAKWVGEITCGLENDPYVFGTAFAIGHDVVLTAGHIPIVCVYKACEKAAECQPMITFKLDGKTYRAASMALSTQYDWAALSFPGLVGPDKMMEGDYLVEPGQEVVMVSYDDKPDDVVHFHTEIVNVVNPVDRMIGSYDYSESILLDMTAKHGYSGSPVLNVDGSLIGIVVRAVPEFQNKALALPVKRIMESKESAYVISLE